MKPSVHIKWTYGTDPETVALANQLIDVVKRLPKICDAVRDTSQWSEEGQWARARFRKWIIEIRTLAAQTGQKEVIDSIESVILHLKGELPSLFDAGGVN